MHAHGLSAKRALLNDEVFEYDALNYLVVSVTLPGMGQVLEATPEHPYLSLRLNLDLEEIARLVLELGDRGPSPAAADRGLFVALLDAPEDIDVLAPVVQREIYYRILRGEAGVAIIASSAPLRGSSSTMRCRCASRHSPPRSQIARLREAGVSA